MILLVQDGHSIDNLKQQADSEDTSGHQLHVEHERGDG